jgi:hypothetical protein
MRRTKDRMAKYNSFVVCKMMAKPGPTSRQYAYAQEFKGLSAFRRLRRGGAPVFPVSPIMLLKTHVEKMSFLSFAIMFMKARGLSIFAIMLLKRQALLLRTRSRAVLAIMSLNLRSF